MNQSFRTEVEQIIAANGANTDLARVSRTWMEQSIRARYSYCFRWLGRPVIQYPQDITAMQELIWDIRPDLVIETGIAHGGSLVLSASLLALLELCDAKETGKSVDPLRPERLVLGVDIDIRPHNRIAIEAHPMAPRIRMIEGSSVDPEVVKQVRKLAEAHSCVLVLLDSNHTHDHVLAELDAYAPLVSPGSYCVVFDTVVENLPSELCPDRPWGPGNNPMTAVHTWLRNHPEFQIDRQINGKLQLSAAPDGYLRRIR